MAKCSACEELRTNAPEFVESGVTNNVCNSLKNNTGMNPSSGRDDYTDLTDAAECLVCNTKDELPAYDVCDWKEFMSHLIPNLCNMFKAIVCAIGGLWDRIAVVSYVGILTLYTTTQVKGSGSGDQRPAFNTHVLQGNLPSGVLTVSNSYTGITIKNTTGVPLLVDTTFNCSIRTQQHFACCFTVVTKDGYKIGQTPFITPDTYDQQVSAEPFILQPGATAVMRYYFRIGNANSWFQSEFGYRSGGSGDPECTLEPNNSSDPENQRSYFSVKVTSIVG